MKVVIPVAGLGSRLKPHTFTTPKPLMEVAGKPILKYVLDDISKLDPTEVILVVGYHKDKVKEYVLKNYSNLNCKFITQNIMDGDGGAVRLGLEGIIKDEELYVIFGADTLIDFNLKKELEKNKGIDSIIFGMEVENPSHYGIMNLKDNNIVYEVEEKPKNPKSNLAIIGAYYFKSSLKVKYLLDEFYRNNERVKNEFKLVQVLDKYINDSELKVKAVKVSKWFDCGRPEVLLEANRYFLNKNSKNSVAVIKKGNSLIIPPVYISNSAKLDRCIVGPYVSISDDVEISNLMVKNSIIGKSSIVKDYILENSLIGKDVYLSGKNYELNIGDKSEINFGK